MTAPEGLDLEDYKFTKLPLGKICIRQLCVLENAEKLKDHPFFNA